MCDRADNDQQPYYGGAFEQPYYDGEQLEHEGDGEDYADAATDAAFASEDGGGRVDFDDQPRQGAAPGGRLVGDGEPAEKPVGLPVFDRLDDWVNHWLIPVYVRNVEASHLTWCAKWWLHPEAYVRLDALWRSWEHHRLQPGTGMSVFMRDHLDHHMTVLLSHSGPFNGCKPEAHGKHLPPLLPTVPMPTDDEIEAAYKAALRALGVEKLKGRHGEIPA